MKFLVASVWPLVGALLAVSPANAHLDQAPSHHNVTKRSTDNLKLVCYYSNWAVYRPGHAKFTPQNINPFLCTHLIYAFAGLSSKYELKAFDPYNDIKQENYKKFVGLKKYNQQLKTMIAIGGWNEGSKRFSKLVATPELRFTFIKSAMKFLREHNFDGLDFDWEYPAFREGSAPEDKDGYAKLIREIRYAFNNEKLGAGKERLLVSVAVPAGQDYIDQGFDVPTIAQYADFLNVLSYDYHTSFDPETDHHAPLKSKPGALDVESSKLNAEWTINYFIKLGAPREKLILGIPTYGRSFTLADAANNGVNALAEGPGEPGPSTREKGYLAFYEICQKVEDEDWQLHRPYPHIEGPFAVKDKQWVAFDDIEIIQDKARFIIDQGLGGAMIWTLDNDDFRGNCYGEQNPLISSLRSALIASTPLVQSSPSEQSSTHLAHSKPKVNLELTEAGLNALNVNTRRNQRRRQFYASTTTSTTTTTTAAPTTTREMFSHTTPEPPTTPDPGIEFTCEDEGFFNNPKDCRKYFWCLDSGPANLGIVAHSFTCPSGLFFNSKTEACDYQGNVSCKVKKEPKNSGTTRKPKSKPKIATTTATQAPTTPMPITTTTTQMPITGPPEDDRMLVDTMQKFNAAQQNGNTDELVQLANLIKSLGGLDKVQNLLQGTSSSKEKNSRVEATSLNFFAPSYVTPKRQSEPVTESPRSAPKSSSEPDRPVRQRRPQFDLETTTQPTTHSLFNYYEKPKSNINSAPRESVPPRTSENESTSNHKQSNRKPFEFNYNTPEGRNTLMSAYNDLNARRQNEMNLYPNATLENTNGERQVYRIPIRVSTGSLVKVPADAIENGLSGRRQGVPKRVRVQSTFAVVSDKPGVLYEDEFIVNNNNPSRTNPLLQAEPFLPPNYESNNLPESPTPFAPAPFRSAEGLSGTQRRRPQNHFNLPLEENPVNMLINTPPRATEDKVNILNSYQTTPAPTSAVPLKFTNYNTLPPEFDISPFTSSDLYNPINANNFQRSREATRGSQPVETTTPLPRISELPSVRPGRRRIARPRRPLPSNIEPTESPRRPTPAPATTSTTTRASKKVDYPSEPSTENFNGPAVFAGDAGNLGCSKRGVHAHPESCGMFVVCAPAGRSKKGLRALTHHCPAGQVFVQDVGRCRPGNKDRCEVF